MNIDYLDTEGFKINCPQCDKEYVLNSYIESDSGYEGSSTTSIEDVNLTCDECKYNLIVEVDEIKVLVIKASARIKEMPTRKITTGSEILIRKTKEILKVNGIESILNLGYLYTLSDNKKYAICPDSDFVTYLKNNNIEFEMLGFNDHVKL